MKRLRSSDSLLPISPSAHQEEKGTYKMAFSSVLESMDDDDCIDDISSSSAAAKKRRLSVDQVRALEKSFEVENKLDPERKVRLAQELSLQPRQVAVWFQNRRARWKTKQLERDYNALKASYDALRGDYDALHDDNEALRSEVKELKTKLGGDDFSEPSGSPESDTKPSELIEDETPTLIYKDGSDSDSSGVLNDNVSPYHTSLVMAPSVFDSTETVNATFPELRNAMKGSTFSFHQLLKTEEYDETCTSWFSDEQPPSLAWCCSDSWNWAEEGGDGNMMKKEGV